ncbi:Ribosomal protein L7Ae/L30e/S12e/Gadd45, partial [Arabidopsis thaliana x Arabidopsis arenosa]
YSVFALRCSLYLSLRFEQDFCFSLFVKPIQRVNMSGDEAVVAPVVPPVAEAAVIPEDMDVSTALELTVRKSRAYGGVVRGLHESAKLIEKRVAQLCVLAEDCNQPDYVKLVKALCADHSIKLLTVPSAKTLGEWAGLCKIDSEGNARKVVGCSCLVIKDYGEETTALNIVKKHLESN